MRLGKWFDVEVSAHWSALILAYLAFNNVSSFLFFNMPKESSAGIYFVSALFSLGLMFSILAHEFGHILVGRRFGIQFNSVMLNGLGGLARMSSPINTAKSEFFMALAGPAVSMLLFGIFALLSVLSNVYVVGSNDTLTTAYNTIDTNLFTLTLMILASTNLVLGLFNLVPAFPMDGGRVFRSSMWAVSKNFRASTLVAANVGRVIGIAAVLGGFLTSFGVHIPFFGTGASSGIWMIILGAFIIFATGQEIKSQNVNLKVI